MWSVLALVLQATAGFTAPMRPVMPAGVPAWTPQSNGCDDGVDRGTLVQRGDLYYGNRIEAACTGARLAAVEFVHAGITTTSAYRIHVLDAGCHEIGVTPVLFTTNPDASPHLESVDLRAAGWCASAEIRVLVEPLGCSQPADCFPAVVVDGGTGSDCARVAVPAPGGRSCLAARTSDGRGFAFRLRVRFDCDSAGCTTAVVPRTWSAAKQLYRTLPPTD
jgi:hypothetical protein